jgi:transposase InsO family protein
MGFVFEPWHLYTLAAVGAAEQEYQRAIAYLMAENKILKEKLGKKRIPLSDDDRRVLAVKGKELGRRALEQIATICTPDTILRWHRELVAKKWDFSARRKSPGRPKVAEEIEELVLRMAKENPSWGYDRIQGALANLGHDISDTTVGNILKANGIEPAPERKKTTTWKTFIRSHWDVLAAVDFTTVEVWTKRGLVTFYLLFVMELATRRVKFMGCTPNPDGPWMKIQARELTACDDGFLNGKKYLLLDRDSKFTAEFRKIIEDQGTECVLLPPKSPNCNSQIERFMLSIKSECLDRRIFFGENSLRKAATEFVTHYHLERNHQGLDNRIIQPGPEVGLATGEIECRERLGGLLNYYYRRVA